MSGHRNRFIAVVTAGAAALVLGALATPAVQAHTAGGSVSTLASVDHAHDPLQPAYVQGGIATYRPLFLSPGEQPTARPQALYEVEYPHGWEHVLARPLCDYCDHFGNGEDAFDYHDHVLSRLPSRATNAAGEVYWMVVHISPAYTGDAAHDGAVSDAYAGLLPATSAHDTTRLLAARLADGSPVAKRLDTGFVFRGPLTRYP